jgi:putative membrane protein
MKVLVLAIDRDDDIGIKTGIKGPIVGREDNVRIANKLALADPEDADTNTMFSAISTLDHLRKDGYEAEIATICGDKDVGHTSDRILTKQLEEVLEEIKPHYAYLVSDGAEDEYIYPIVASRIKVNHVKRVFVKQSSTIESTFYLIVKTLKDVRMRRKILAPFILILMIIGILGFLIPFLVDWYRGVDLLLNVQIYIGPFIALGLGLYFLFWAYPIHLSFSRMSAYVVRAYKSVKKALVEGDFSLVFTIIGLVLIIIGIFLGMDVAVRDANNAVEGVFFFIGGAFLWVILGVLTHEGGKVAKAYQDGTMIKPSFWVVTIALFVALIVFSLLILAAFNLMGLLLNLKSADTVLILTFIEIAISLIVIIAGSILYRSMQEKAAKEDAWRR